MTAQELFEKVVVRMTVSPPQMLTFVDAVNSTLEIIGRVLLQKQSSLLKLYSSVELVAGVQAYPLPEGFWGMIDSPYIPSSGDQSAVPLHPLSHDQAYSYFGSTGVPESFEIEGDGLMLIYPIPDVAYTINLGYAARPAIELITDDIPFNGLFDKLIEDAVVRVGTAGGWVTISPDWIYIENGINQLMRSRSPRKMTLMDVRSTWA